MALGMDEMMRQVRSLQLAVTGVYVDGEGTKIGNCPPAPATSEKEPSKGFLTTDISFYNKQIIGLVGESSNSGEPMQSPGDLMGAKPDPNLGPISFHYTPIWAADPEPWSPGALSGTVVSPQPTVVRNTGLSWEVEVARHHQLIITTGRFTTRTTGSPMSTDTGEGASTASRESSLMVRSTWSITTFNIPMSR